MSNRTYVLHCQFFRLDECLENADRQPRMLFNQRLAYSNHMHNGKDADASEVVRFGLAVIRKTPVDVRRPVRLTGWCQRSDPTIQDRKNAVQARSVTESVDRGGRREF